MKLLFWVGKAKFFVKEHKSASKAPDPEKEVSLNSWKKKNVGTEMAFFLKAGSHLCVSTQMIFLHFKREVVWSRLLAFLT